MTAALWTGARAWLVAAALYLPESWTSDAERCQRAHVPEAVRFQTKGQLALTLLRQVRASGLTVTAVLSDSGYGDATMLRTALHRLKLPYGLGMSLDADGLSKPPVAAPAPRRAGAPHAAGHPGRDTAALSVKALAASLPAAAWHRVSWRHGDNPARAAQCAAVRVTPAHDWQHGHLLPEIWLLCERPDDGPAEKYYFINLPPRTALARLVTFVASAVVHRATVSTAQDRTRPGSLRGPHLSGLAPSCGHQRGRLCLPATGTDAAGAGDHLSKPSAPSCKRCSSACCSPRVRATPGGCAKRNNCSRCGCNPTHSSAAARPRRHGSCAPGNQCCLPAAAHHSSVQTVATTHQNVRFPDS